MNGFNTLFLKRQQTMVWSSCDGLIHNRSFLFGDGLFETMVSSKGKLLDFSLHLERLQMGLEVLGMTAEGLSSQEELEHLISLNAADQALLRIRWNVFRSGQGKYSPESMMTDETLQIQSFSPAPKVKFIAMISSTHKLYPHVWANCKTSNALVYVLANQERVQHQMDEVILLDDQGNVSEAGAANIFWKKGETYFTPSLATHCIAGIGRAKICKLLQENGNSLQIGEYSIKEMLSADKVFTSNVTGISYLKEIEGKTFATVPELALEGLFDF